MITVYLITLTGLILGQLSPGPSFLAVSGAALGQGRRPAFFVSIGIACATLTWALITAVGFGALLQVYPSILVVMKLLGGGYLIFLALKSLRSAIQGGDIAIKLNRQSWTPGSAFSYGFLVNITNPKTALVWSGVASFLFGSGLSTLEAMGFAPIGFMSALIVFCSVSALFSTSFARRSYSLYAHIFETLFGIAFCMIGLKLMVDGFSAIL